MDSYWFVSINSRPSIFKHLFILGNAINRPSQLSLSKATTRVNTLNDGTRIVATGGLYAPTIRHHNGITYIICTNVLHSPSNNLGDEESVQFIIHTKDIRAGIWSDPLTFSFPGIDPSFLFEEGKVYVQACRVGPEFQIFNFEIDIETGHMLTEPALIWKGWAHKYTEGPHIYKKDGWYYLLCAEGGTFRHHMLSMARSKSVWGPFDAYDNNPIYTADGSDSYFQNTGHGDLFQDQYGGWHVVMLGVRMRENRFIMGRETFLAAVSWNDCEWPSLKTTAADVRTQKRPRLIRDKSTLQAAWVHIRNPTLEDYRILENHITMRARPAGLHSSNQIISFAGQRQRELVGTASVTLAMSQYSVPVQAGLAFFKDEHRFLTLAYDFGKKLIVFHGLNRAKSFEDKRAQRVEIEDFIELKIKYTETSLHFFFKDPQGSWQCLQVIDTINLTDFDFTGPVIGVFAEGDDVEVEFSGITIDDIDSI